MRGLQLRVAVWLLDLCRVEDAVIGDLIELYHGRRAGWSLWGEVSAAMTSCIATRISNDRPQAIRWIATAAAVLWFFSFTVNGTEQVDLATSLRLESVATGWFEAGNVNGQVKVVPVVSFQLRNTSATPLSSVQVNVLFRRVSESHEWADVFRRPTAGRPLLPGATTDDIVVPSPAGYTGQAPVDHLLSHAQFVDTAVSVYARRGSEKWTYLGQDGVPRQIIGGWRPSGPLPEQSGDSLRLR